MRFNLGYLSEIEASCPQTMTMKNLLWAVSKEDVKRPLPYPLSRSLHSLRFHRKLENPARQREGSRIICSPRIFADVNLALAAHVNIERPSQWREKRVDLRFVFPVCVLVQLRLKNIETDTILNRADKISESCQKKSTAVEFVFGIGVRPILCRNHFAFFIPAKS